MEIQYETRENDPYVVQIHSMHSKTGVGISVGIRSVGKQLTVVGVLCTHTEPYLSCCLHFGNYRQAVHHIEGLKNAHQERSVASAKQMYSMCTKRCDSPQTSMVSSGVLPLCRGVSALAVLVTASLPLSTTSHAQPLQKTHVIQSPIRSAFLHIMSGMRLLLHPSLVICPLLLLDIASCGVSSALPLSQYLTK